MNKAKFNRIINDVLEIIVYEPDWFTCSMIARAMNPTLDKLYKKYLKAHLLEHECSLDIKINGEYDDDLSRMRRYFIVDSFKQEILSTEKYKEL